MLDFTVFLGGFDTKMQWAAVGSSVQTSTPHKRQHMSIVQHGFYAKMLRNYFVGNKNGNIQYDYRTWPRTQESGSNCSPGPSSRAELSRDLGGTPRFNPYGLNTVGWKDQWLNQTEGATTPKPKSRTSPGDYQDSHPEPAQELKEEDQRNVFCNANSDLV